MTTRWRAARSITGPESTPARAGRHEIDLTLKGFGEARAQQQHEQGAEKHKRRSSR
jgi:hypothetical protein